MKSNSTNYTLEGLSRRRREIDAQIAKSRKNINRHWTNLVTPSPAETRMQAWVGQAERAFAVYDGFMTAYKLFKKFNSFRSKFTRKHKDK